MLVFAICLVFGAHPDFWLIDAAFEQKRLKDDIANLEQANAAVANYVESVAQGKIDKDARITESLQFWVDKGVRRLDKARVVERTRALINNDSHRPRR